MENTIEVRKVTQDVLLFVWFKHGALSEEPPRELGLIPEISDELMNNLSASVWIESFRNQFIWDDFFKKHFERMTSSPKLFANYVAYACCVLNESANVYECFFDILSIVSEFSLRCIEGNRTAYLNICVDLFCIFFEKELYRNFKDQGGWKKFNEYIGKQYNSIESKSMINDNKSPVNLFEYFPEALERGNRPDYVISRVLLKKRTQPYYVVNGIVLKDITQNRVETHEKAVSFIKSIYKLKKLVPKTFEKLIIDFTDTYIQVANLYRWSDEEPSNGMKSEDEQWNLVKHGRKKKQLEQCSSQEVQQTPGGIKNRGVQRKICQESSGGMERKGKQCSSRKVQEPPGGMKSKEVQRKIDQESSSGKKNQVEQCSLQKVLKPPGGMQSKGALRKKDQECSDGMKNQVEHYSLNVEEASKIISCKTKVMKKELEGKTVAARDTLKTQNLDTINLQDRTAPVQASHLKLKSTSMETAKILLGNMSLAIAKISELIQSLCEKHGVQVPVQLQRNSNV